MHAYLNCRSTLLLEFDRSNAIHPAVYSPMLRLAQAVARVFAAKTHDRSRHFAATSISTACTPAAFSCAVCIPPVSRVR